MKRKRNTRSGPAPKAQPAGQGSAARRLGFRLAALMTPLVLLGGVEVGLRLIGYGHPTGFFLPVRDAGRDMLISNPRFGWRFFPPAIARAPRPLYLEARKPPDTVRIFVFGESAAMGDPEPTYGVARQLQTLLQARHPGRRFEVINAAMTAINSHVIREIAQDCAPLGGDFWLVYAGNNEVIGPFGAGTVFGRQSPKRSLVRLVLGIRSTRVGQWFTQLTRAADEPKVWEGLEFFLKWQVPEADPRLNTVYASFAANLNDLAELGQASGATVILSTMPVNLGDFPPLASGHATGLPPAALATWSESFAAGLRAQADGQSTAALAEFRKAGAVDDDFAELSYQRARCEAAAGQVAAADSDFRRARDRDALRFRADSRINELTRQVARARGLALVDADQEFAAPEDERLFHDHVHLNFSGNYRLAVRFAAELEKHWPAPGAAPGEWLTEAEVAQRLGWTGFDERRVLEEMRARLQQPPFTAQSNFQERDARLATMLAALPKFPTNEIPIYEQAIARTPEDWMLHANFARVREAAGDLAGAEAEWARVSQLMPHQAEGWANQARLARSRGEPERARQFLSTALRLQPDAAAVLTEAGLLHASLGENDLARRQFRAALRQQPGEVAARVNLGLLLAREGKESEAAQEYLEALRWQTNNVEARINLANLRVAQGRTNEAGTWYDQAVALDPANAIARYNYGRLLVAQNRLAEALGHFQSAIQQRPELAELHFELGNLFTRLGREAAALPEFAEAVRLKPEFAEAHLNLGVALARDRRYSEAIAEFRATLKLNPQDARAQRMLEQALRLAEPH